MACSPVFDSCNLINFELRQQSGNVTPFYNAGCYSNTPAGGNVFTEETPLYTVRVNPIALTKLVAADGTPIAASVNYKVAEAGGALKISAEGIPDTYWEVGVDSRLSSAASRRLRAASSIIILAMT